MNLSQIFFKKEEHFPIHSRGQYYPDIKVNKGITRKGNYRQICLMM